VRNDFVLCFRQRTTNFYISVWPSHSVVMTGCDNGVLVLRDLSRQVLLLSFDFGPDFSIISAHVVGHAIVVLSGPCLDAGFSSIGITKRAKSEKPRICKLSMISFSGVLLHEVRIANSEEFHFNLKYIRLMLTQAHAPLHFVQIHRIWSRRVYCFWLLGASLMYIAHSIWAEFPPFV
jgi:hypothetical protein